MTRALDLANFEVVKKCDERSELESLVSRYVTAVLLCVYIYLRPL